MRLKHTLFIFLNSFALFTAIYIWTRSLWTLLFFVPVLLFVYFMRRKHHA